MRFSFEGCLVVAGVLCVAVVSNKVAAQGQQLEIDVTFFDFNGPDNTGDKSSGVGLAPDPINAHPDFEFDMGHCWDAVNQSPTFLGGMAHSILDTGIVQSMLSVDGVPVHSGSSFSTNNDAGLFDKWYKHDPDYNVMLTDTLVLDQIGSSNAYGIDSNAFFPLDGKGLGNTISLDADGLTPDCGIPFYNGTPIESGHNWHWTMHISTEFVYEGGETFSFRGDDDLWVFIDGELALDLGGLHAATGASEPFVSGSIDLDTIIGLAEVGTTHQFDLFYAERYHNDSNFKMETSIPIGEIVPEPASAAFSLAGILGLAARRRTRG
ncbi:MAG: fibro-slime domain-containing protein [Planctomycetota bacterium]